MNLAEYYRVWNRYSCCGEEGHLEHFFWNVDKLGFLVITHVPAVDRKTDAVSAVSDSKRDSDRSKSIPETNSRCNFQFFKFNKSC